MHRYKLTTGQKIIIGVGFALLIWRLLLIPAVFNPLIDFLGAGVIPGTQQELAPDTILKVLLGLFIATAVVLFIRLFVWRRPFGFSPIRKARASTSPSSRPRRLPSVSSLPALPRVQLVMPAWWAPLAARALAVARKTARRTWALAVVLAGQSWAWLEPRLRQFDTWLEVRLNTNEITRMVLDVGRKVVAFVQDTWHKSSRRL